MSISIRLLANSVILNYTIQTYTIQTCTMDKLCSFPTNSECTIYDIYGSKASDSPLLQTNHTLFLRIFNFDHLQSLRYCLRCGH
uniref:Uncharacterized protein n=1 Tax=Manihot esculenta TaxID=3983 RepID=A0A2C9VRR5_MANES